MTWIVRDTLTGDEQVTNFVYLYKYIKKKKKKKKSSIYISPDT